MLSWQFSGPGLLEHALFLLEEVGKGEGKTNWCCSH